MTTNTIKRLHVNQYSIRANAKNNDAALPVFTIKNRGKTFIGSRVQIEGPSEMVYAPEDPLSCGAKCWVETRSPVVLHTSSTESIRIA